MSVSTTITISAAAAALAASSVAVVQAALDDLVAKKAADPVKWADLEDSYAPADIAYVYTGCARMGLTRLSSPKRTFTAADYAVLPAALATITLVAADDDDAAAQAIATALGVSKARVLSKAVCTGLATLNGHDIEDGPYG